jgi:hypothetical protein
MKVEKIISGREKERERDRDPLKILKVFSICGA